MCHQLCNLLKDLHSQLDPRIGRETKKYSVRELARNIIYGWVRHDYISSDISQKLMDHSKGGFVPFLCNIIADEMAADKPSEHWYPSEYIGTCAVAFLAR